MRIRPKYLKPKHIKIAGIILASLFLITSVTLIIAYSKREAILKSVISKAVNKAKRDYHLNLKINNPKFEGLRTVAFSEITVIPENRDSLVHLKDLHISIRLLPLLTGDLKISSLKISSGKINLVKRDSIRNYDFLFRKKSDSTKTKSRADLAELAHKLLNQALNKVPENMMLNNFEILLVHDEDRLRFLSTATIDNGDLTSTIKVNDTESVWHVNGMVDPENNQLHFKLFAAGKKVELPLIEKKLGLRLNFDTLYTSLNEAKKSGRSFKIYTNFAVKNLLINHPKIAANNIIVPSGSIDADIMIGENYVGLDSSSVIHLNQITANPYIKYTLSPHKIYELKLKTDQLDAQKLFNSFPIGLFESLDGIKVSGQLRYDMDFYLDAKMPDSVRFNSSLHKTNFKVLKWGKADLSKINHPFVYTPYEYGKPMRNIIIGPQNPDYVPINQISPYLRNAVLTAEDPSFFSHNGFVEKAFQRSIATNFKEKAFVRGGSTISMQLVKNVFLNRQKTLARKIEEILIVWIMENTHVSTKQRMFEVYLNLIEWGRNIYGIGEASRFYFNKHPSELSLGESIFLANIVPRPKKGLYFFEGDGSLTSGLRGYFKLIGGLMARRGYVARDTNAYGFYNVRLKESLRTGSPVNTSGIDSLLIEEDPFMNDEDPDSFFSRIFGRKKKPDTIYVSSSGKTKIVRDTVKTPAQLRQERREQRRRERELRQQQD